MAETVIFEEQTLTFPMSDDTGTLELYPAPFTLSLGEVYRVMWNGVEHQLICIPNDLYGGAPYITDIVTDEENNYVSGTFKIGYASPELTGQENGAVLMMAIGITETYTISVSHIETEALFPYQEVGFSTESAYGVPACGLEFGVGIDAFDVTVGESYLVAWNGAVYDVVAQDVSSLAPSSLMGSETFALGNFGPFVGGDDTGEPFAIAYVPDDSVLFLSVTDTESTIHSVGIFKMVATKDSTGSEETEEDPVLLLDHYTIDGFVDTGDGVYGVEINPAICTLVEGETYTVIWDDEPPQVCTCSTVLVNNIGYEVIGNVGLLGGEDTGESFLLASVTLSGETIATGNVAIASNTNASHTLTLYKGVYQEEEDSGSEEEPNPETQEGIVLKDRNGNDVAYYGIETVTFDTTTEGKQQVYTKGEAVEELEIIPDFSEGDQTVTAGDNTLIKSATIVAPADLSPENVRKGKEIAGVTGEFIGDTEAVVVGTSEDDYELTFANDDTIEVTPSTEDKVLSSVTIKKPENLLPENIAKDIEIAGVVGTYASNVELEGDFLPYVAYNINLDTMELTICAIKFSKLYEDTGSYDVNIPDTFGDFTVIIDSEGV